MLNYPLGLKKYLHIRGRMYMNFGEEILRFGKVLTSLEVQQAYMTCFTVHPAQILDCIAVHPVCT